MDFSRDESQEAIAEAVAALLASGTGDVWARLLESGLGQLAIPAAHGGEGLGAVAVATLLEELGRRAVRSPALATFGLGVLPLAQLVPAHPRLGAPGVLTAALSEPGAPLTATPATTFDGTVRGTKVGVPYAADAAAMLVSTDRGLVLVEPGAGVHATRTPASADAPEYVLRFDNAPGELIAPDNTVALRCAVAAMGAYADGLLAGALELTAAHVRTRHQFGKPLATFQAVAQQIADVYVAARTLHVAAVAAAWGLAESDLDVLAYWVSTAAPRALQTCQHLHGGLGVDITYPLHQYFSLTKDLSRWLGGPDHRLELLGVRCSSI